MNNSTLFIKAHKLTKSVIREGDSYQVTFAACLKAVKAEEIAAKTCKFKYVFSISQTIAMLFLFVVLTGSVGLLVIGLTGSVSWGLFWGAVVATGTVFYDGPKSAFYLYKYVTPQTKFVF